MIITKTPYRISLFGGGSDFPQWYGNKLGRVISFTIDKYCYISARFLPQFFDHKFRVVYSKTEEVAEVEQINHPAVRESLKWLGISKGIEIHHFGDLPARSGVGSSSAFAVGLLCALSELTANGLGKKELAQNAINLEREKLKENVGSQDQIACSYGGLNEITFENNDWKIKPIEISQDYLQEIEDRMVLVFSGISRNSSDISQGLLNNYSKKSKLIESTVALSKVCGEVFKNQGNLDEVGILLNESWQIKKELNPISTNLRLDQLYLSALKNGALGGKVLGAGGGGFMLFWLGKDKKIGFVESLENSLNVPFRLEFKGCETIFNSKKR